MKGMSKQCHSCSFVKALKVQMSSYSIGGQNTVHTERTVLHQVNPDMHDI